MLSRTISRHHWIITMMIDVSPRINSCDEL